jgi:hypothetical protein
MTSMADQLKGREGFNKIKNTIKKMLKAIREEREARGRLQVRLLLLPRLRRRLSAQRRHRRLLLLLLLVLLLESSRLLLLLR